MSDFFASARDRAFALAITAGYSAWPEVAAELAAEGYGHKAIALLGRDKDFKHALTLSILTAQKLRETEQKLQTSSRMSPSLPISALNGRR